MKHAAQNVVMTVADVIAEMAISRSTWQKLAAKGQTPPIIRIGGLQRIRREGFEDWMRQHEEQSEQNIRQGEAC